MTRKRVIKPLLIFSLLFLVALILNVIWKTPVNLTQSRGMGELGADYYRGVFGGLYMRGIRDCSSWFFPVCEDADTWGFLRDRFVKGADPDTFMYVGSYDDYHDWSDTSDVFKDKNHIIIRDEVIPDSDPSSIQLMNGFAKDKRNIYIGGKVIKHFDVSTFKYLGCGFFKDNNGIYFGILYENGDKPLTFVDKDSFEMFDRKGKACNLVPYVAKDKNNYYQADVSGLKIVKPVDN